MPASAPISSPVFGLATNAANGASGRETRHALNDSTTRSRRSPPGEASQEAVMFALVSIGGVVVLAAVLVWNLRKRFAAEGVRRYKDGRRPSARVVSSAEFIDGSRRIPVSLALNRAAL